MGLAGNGPCGKTGAMSAPPAPLSVTCHLRSAEETAELARKIARHVSAGDTLLLEGPLGAGKTHFARALIQQLLAEHGLHEDVPSPTFTLVQTYDTGPLEIWHADLYRLSSPDELIELGLEDAFEAALCLVEWPDRLGAHVPDWALMLSFSHGADEADRDLTLRTTNPKWAPLIAELGHG